ncbi:MAG: hypothetical protein A2268_15250 [Candidatus Raymondbacteria bacterium RifOxyA12_full_50_37]|uniref:Uncharacterized protein n=1 Tax=Candidatus Raymondbacteria bacterium RIFOXYD12_FULL_49_13 TaxID=1817890 RepID=A0A1F7F6T3_UNCRA|nr:MAG: hypothetical protein A2268_15250 [Candidatus Raymondbacteria bacterium RifOxyA12_full_50_37]OGJ88489.1 MAG: hypothetical protein A2248_20015 [Candidatus Raymondbacteria bacterium RIFOXYA2_FULL_49_16]OGJ90629.1 MAG: hypothetical protein A2350_18500 [Candidatus Raymondbacteria bacterium RifOxyB12_full_50_8]OGJ96199.1 MAG: hypothetical protein A2487_01430 [Candidatus Raymondbacteria bacterium RifOxyC12_full_50_8]OGJ98949.1 MAG: hypothetical protein A2453_10730 [Candidatus Raymondbacteria b
MRHTIEVELPGKTRIRILELPVFLATKFEAFFDRGNGVFYTSHDFEDIVNVLAYRKSYQELEAFPLHLKKAFKNWANIVTSEKGILSTISSHLPPYESIKVSEKVLDVFKKLA